jgi:hypothetical protein
MRVTQPVDASTLLSIDPERCRRVDLAQGRESFDFAQDREPVERLAERPFGFTQGHELVEWQMGVFRQPQWHSARGKIYIKGWVP